MASIRSTESFVLLLCTPTPCATCLSIRWLIILYLALNPRLSRSRPFLCIVQVRQRHRLGTVVTPYHIREAGEYFGLDEKDVRECVQELGGTVWEEDDDQVRRVGPSSGGHGLVRIF